MLSKIQTQQLFSEGNYTQVAMFSTPLAWEKYASFALIGKSAEAISYFKDHRHNINANFYEGVAYWMDGNDELACQLLAKVPTAHARNLLKLIQQEKITILAQVPWIRKHFTDWLAGVEDDPKFQVKNISFHPDDIPNKPYADIHQFYDLQKPPDFYICQMVEWHLIPPNLQELPCPIFGQTADYDLHIQTVYPWLQLFDELLVTDGTEWNDVSKLVSVPVSTFPKSFCLPKTLPKLELKPRPIDLYLSGTVTHPYHPDKAYLLSQILRVPELDVRVVHGFTSTDEYYENLSNSKVCFTYVRHLGATPTRGLEALSLGCGLVTQEGSALTLFARELEGVRTYSYDRDDLTENLIYIAQNWSDYQWKANKGAKIIRREFSAEKVASQFLRYLTFLAAKPDIVTRRKKINQDKLVQKRTVLQKGWLPSYDFNQCKILSEICEENLSRLSKIEKPENLSPEIAINKAREITLFNSHHSVGSLFPKIWVKEVEEIYNSAIAEFPTSLVLRFNFFRTIVHFGNPIQVSQAINIATEVTKHSLDYWSIDYLEDVLPYDIFLNYFNYRAYFDCLLETLGLEQNIKKDKLVQIILASIHYYLGLYTQNSNSFITAFNLDPNFAKYKLSYLKKEIKTSINLDENLKLKSILLELAQGTTEFLQAYKIIDEQILIMGINKSQSIGSEIQPICTSIKDIETKHFDLLRPSIRILVNPLKHGEFTKALIFQYSKNFGDFIISYIPKFVRNTLDVQEHDITPFSPCLDATPELLRQRINDMKHSKFLFVFHLLNKDSMNNLYYLNTEDLIHKIHELEATHAWQLRTHWFKLKIKIKQNLLHLKNFYSHNKYAIYTIHPTLIFSTKHYNFVVWKKKYYGIPKSLGYIDLPQINLDEYYMILVEDSLQKLKRRIKYSQRSISLNYSKYDIHVIHPTLIFSTKYYNIIVWERKYYGIPKSLGNIDLHQINLDEYDVILAEDSLQKLKKKIKYSQTSISLKLLDKEIKSYCPLSDFTPKDLCDRISTMRTSKFLLFESSIFSFDKYTKNSELFSSDILLAEIYRLEKTRSWRLRTIWLRIKRGALQIMSMGMVP